MPLPIYLAASEARRELAAPIVWLANAGRIDPDLIGQTRWRTATGEARYVASTDVGSIQVSTCFVGLMGTLTHPRPYETAVFGCDEEWAQDLHTAHASIEDAQEWHAQAVEIVREHLR